MPSYDASVFINCPFDDAYGPTFRALVFAVHDSGFFARCAREADNAGEVRIQKIARIIRECRHGIHDLSRTDLDPHIHLPRFNMPLELGIFFGAQMVGSGKQKTKNCLILDMEKYRYRDFCSDISGQDIKHTVEILSARLRQLAIGWEPSAWPMEWVRSPGPRR
jgi:hypothetical protein